jgi:Mannosyltransferase (PIG-V)
MRLRSSEQAKRVSLTAPAKSRPALHASTWAPRMPALPPWLRDTLALFLASRLAILLITYVGYTLLLAPKYSTTSVGVSGLLLSWDRWDALWYTSIAAYGYTAPDATAFFPLYPLLIRAVTVNGQWYYAAGLVLSNLAFLGAMVLLRVLVAAEWSESVARRAVLYLTVFPTALYTFAPYNESLFLLFTVGTFLALRGRRWALAGALGGLAVLTRSAGILLVIPFAWEWWQWRRGADLAADWGKPGSAAHGVSRSFLSRALPSSEAGAHIPRGALDDRGTSSRRRALTIGWALLIPAGLGIFAVFCAIRFGDPLAFAHAQQQWNRVLAWPWQSLWWQLIGLWSAAPASFFQVHDLLDLGATALFLGLLVAGWRRLPTAQSLYMAGLLLLILIEPGGVHLHANDPLSSNQRFVLEMFPGFITLGLLTARRPRRHQAILIGFSCLLATLTLVFILGHWLV